MRREKCDRRHFKRMLFSFFNGEESPLDYADIMLDIVSLDTIQIYLEVIPADCKWFSNHKHFIGTIYVNGSTGWRWHLSLSQMVTFYRFKNVVDRCSRYFHIPNMKSFFTAEVLNLAISDCSQ